MIAPTLLIIFLMVLFIMQKNKYKTIDKMIEQGERALKEPTA
jgi:septation ring formation regulator EzrA